MASRAAATTASAPDRAGRRPPPRPPPARRGAPPPRRRRASSAAPRLAACPGAGRPASQARSSRSWRRASAATSRGLVGAALNHRQRLEHRVVQVRRHLGALLRADPLGALGRERAHEADDPGGEDHAEHHDHGEHREQHVPGGAERAGGLEEGDAGGDHERHAHAGPRDATAAVRAVSAGRAGGAGLPGGGAGRGRPAAPVRRPSDWRQISTPPVAISTSGQTMASENQSPSAAEREQRAQQQQPAAERHLHRGAGARGRGARSRGARRRPAPRARRAA